MKIARYIPGDILKPFIRHFIIIESEDGMATNVLPDTSLVIAFRFKGMVTCTAAGIQDGLPSSVISGIRKSSRIMSYSKATGNLLVIFHEAGAAAFFREPLHELSDMSLPLDMLMSARSIQDVEEQLAEAGDHVKRIAIIERWLSSKLKNPAPDPLVQHAIQKIQQRHGAVKMKDLADSLYISQDAFEKRFRRQAGASPKQFSSIVRFKHVIAAHTEAGSLTDAALTAGYFDQAHFIKDFRSFTGKSPQDFFREVVYW